MMEIIVSQEGDRALFKVRGDIDELGAEDLKNRFRELDISSLREASFDFGKVNHIGSAGIGKLLLFYKDLALKGGKIKILNVSETIYELLKVLKLDTIFDISKK
ncbi:STAS domain-containing protein [Desulfococcaceae bacterium HSG8]|nr:STAS domain-containing protein [Desulfococcaceae bacterium HSG8]